MNNKVSIFFVLTFCISFLAGCSNQKCHHELVINDYVAPTCETSGKTGGISCSKCGEVLVAQTDILPLGHEIVEDVGTLASCNDAGMTEGLHCARCGKIIKKQEIIPAQSHKKTTIVEQSIPHFCYSKCLHCEKVDDYTMPVIFISCEKEPEQDLGYVDCDVTSFFLDEYQINNSKAEIKVRGNWTSSLVKKPYRIKFDAKQNLFGLNNGLKAKSWVLLADYADKSMIRNASAFYLAKQIFGDKYYSSDCCFVEVYINDDYKGVYLLTEQQQVGKGRIDVFEDKKDNSNNVGFLLEYDQYYWKEDPSVVFEINYNQIPYFNNGFISDNSHFIKQYVIKSDTNNSSQKEFIQDRLQKIWDIAHNSLYEDHSDILSNPFLTIGDDGCVIADSTIQNSHESLSRVIDINSLVQTYLFNEVVQDMDIGYSSFYLSLDMSERGNKKLTFQAPWDFDWCFGNSVNNIHQLFIGNYLEKEPNHEKSNPWLLLVSNEKWFWELMKNEWVNILKNSIKEKLIQMIDFFTNNYQTNIAKEYKRWDEKKNLIVWCSSENTLSATTQKDDAKNVINYLEKRFDWLNYYFEDLTRVKPNFV